MAQTSTTACEACWWFNGLCLGSRLLRTLWHVWSFFWRRQTILNDLRRNWSHCRANTWKYSRFVRRTPFPFPFGFNGFSVDDFTPDRNIGSRKSVCAASIASWCVMTSVHETGHILCGWACGDTPKLLEHGAHPIWIAIYCLLTIGCGYIGFRRQCVRVLGRDH